jgi:sugar phosphate isomerase/epimerase
LLSFDILRPMSATHRGSDLLTSDMTDGPITINRALVAACWTSAGDIAPLKGDGTSPIDIRTRIEAVAGTGWTGMGIVHADLVRARDTIGLRGLGELLADNGLVTLELEFIRDWWTTGARRAASDRVRHDLLRAAAELDVRTVKAGAKNGGDPVDRDRFLFEFDRLATEARDAGTRIALEATASSDVLPTVSEAIEVVQAVGNPHGGLCVDVWHTGRSGTSHSELAGMLPLDKVFAAELSDGGAGAPESIWDEETNHRRLPGDGAFDVAGFVVVLHELGYRGHWGVEIMSEEHRGLPIRTALERAYASAIRTLDAAQARLAERSPRTA